MVDCKLKVASSNHWSLLRKKWKYQNSESSKRENICESEGGMERERESVGMCEWESLYIICVSEWVSEKERERAKERKMWEREKERKSCVREKKRWEREQKREGKRCVWEKEGWERE